MKKKTETEPFGGPTVDAGDYIKVLRMWSTDLFNGQVFMVKEWRTDMRSTGLPSELPSIDTGTGNSFVTAWEVVENPVDNMEYYKRKFEKDVANPVRVFIDGTEIAPESKEDTPKKAYVDVANQSHYVSDGVEPIDLIRSLGILAPFCQGNILKYISRYNKKGGLEDLKKAQVYLDWLIDEVESE